MLSSCSNKSVDFFSCSESVVFALVLGENSFILISVRISSLYLQQTTIQT